MCKIVLACILGIGVRELSVGSVFARKYIHGTPNNETHSPIREIPLHIYLSISPSTFPIVDDRSPESEEWSEPCDWSWDARKWQVARYGMKFENGSRRVLEGLFIPQVTLLCSGDT